MPRSLLFNCQDAEERSSNVAKNPLISKMNMVNTYDEFKIENFRICVRVDRLAMRC